MPRKGNPPIPVRASDEAKAPWKAAAASAGLTLTAWVHQTLNAAAGVSPSGQPWPELIAAAAGHGPTAADVKEAQDNRQERRAFADALAPDPVGQMPDCPHPRAQRIQLGYGTKCGQCGKVNP